MTDRPVLRNVRSADGTTIGFFTLGSGPGLVVVGGSLAEGQNYLRLARSLATGFTVHVVDRRGRGRSGPQGPGYDLGTEVADLLAVLAATGARTVFGHSFGGLVCLETALASTELERVAAYEPGVLINGCMPGDWLPRFSELLGQGDTRGAFATMVRSVGFAPPALSAMPLWCAKLILRLVVRGEDWRHKESLLGTQALEHGLLSSVTDSPARYAGVRAQVLVLVGGDSPGFSGSDLLAGLTGAIPGSTGESLDGLGHTAPSEDDPDAVADAVLRWLRPAAPEPQPAPLVGR